MVARCSGTVRFFRDGSSLDDLFNHSQRNSSDDVGKPYSRSWDGSLHDDHGVGHGVGIFDLGAGGKFVWSCVHSVDCGRYACFYGGLQFLVSS